MKTFEAGKIIKQGSYAAFNPNPINKEWIVDDMRVLKLLSQADRQLGRLDMYSEHVNIDLYIMMHIAMEATKSSMIEGTQTNMKEAFMNKEDINPGQREDWEEVQNYIAAMKKAIELSEVLPFSNRLIKQTHEILLRGVRGQNKMPVAFRQSQNWIGGKTIQEAAFVPPPHHLVPELMSDLEKFANDDESDLPDLIKVAIIHYQFETIHPFLDGNGRIGRLIITLYLVSKGILKQPILYLSDYFEKYRSTYYDNLMSVRTEDDLAGWIKFFLKGVTATAKKAVDTFTAIIQLQKSMDARLEPFGNRANDMRKVLNELYSKPVVDASEVTKIIQKSSVSAYKLISDMEKAGILKEITGQQRGRIYTFNEYLLLFM